MNNERPFEIIPAIDLLGGQVVRLTQGDYAQVSHYAKTPVDVAKWYCDQGATRIHLVDLDGAKDGQLKNLSSIVAIRKAVGCYLDLGGGIRSLDTAKTLLDVGIDELILGSLLIKNRPVAEAIVEAFPFQITAGIDAHGEWVATEGWIKHSSVSIKTVLQDIATWKLVSIIYTDISRDGTLTGPNLESLQMVAKHAHGDVIASGGVSSMEDIEAIRQINGVKGCIVGKAILEGKIGLGNSGFNKS